MSSLDDIFAKKRKAPSTTASSSDPARKKLVVEKAPLKKSTPKVVKAPEVDRETLDAQEIFRRHFEAQFKPIEKVVEKLDKKAAKKSTKKNAVPEQEPEDEDDDDEDFGSDGDLDLEGLGDFDGLSADSGSSDDDELMLDGEESQADDNSDEEDGQMLLPGLVKPTPKVEVVSYETDPERPKMSKAEMKAFMSSKPPTDPSSIIGPDVVKNLGDGDGDEPGEKDNLKNDLALQRLLAESHLIQSGQDSLSHTGKAHHKATDLRLQALGAKTSVFTQAKMPLSHRKGMLKKSAEKEEMRRREARENGIILERIKGGKGASKERRPQDRRERGVGAPAVGRFEGGTLRISKRDVYEIEGPKKREGKSGRGGRGGGRGGRGGKRGGRGK